MKRIEITSGICTGCGSTRDLTGSQDVERHTRKVSGGRRIHCYGTGRKPLGWKS